MNIRVAQEQGRVPITVFHIQGQMNLGTAEQLEQAARAALDGGTRYLLVDLSEVSSLTSAGLRALHGLYRMLGAFSADGREARKSANLKLLNPLPDIRRVLQVAGFDSFIDIHDDFRTAVASFGEGVYALAPMLSVRNGARAVEFYKLAFGATEVYRLDGPDGSVVARLSVSGAEFWLSDESPEHGNFSPESLGGNSARIILTVPDPDGVFAQALAAGAQLVHAVEEAHGWRMGRVVDPFGHHWEIGRPLAST